MADLTAPALRLAITQHGVISMAQLVERGVSGNTTRRLVRTGRLIRAAKSVYRLPTDTRSLEQRCVELCLAHPAAFVTGPSAGTLMGLRKMPKRSPITMSSRHPLHLDISGVRFRRTTRLDARDTVRRRDGIRLASPARLAFDLAAALPERDHRSVLDQLIHEHDVTLEELSAVGRRLCHPARRGSARFVSALVDLSDCPTESDAERCVAEALRARGVPVDTNRDWLDLPDGGRARLDLSVRDVRWGVEIDVHPSHLGLIGSTDDKRRDRQAGLIRWRIHRVTAIDLVDIDGVADELTQLYRLRVAELAA